jgi:hypothetical protein
MPRFAPAAALLLALAGCDVNIHEGKASVGVFSAEANEEWTHHYALTADGVVEIVNINGPIVISTGAAGTVEVHASAMAKTISDAGARDILAKGKIQEISEPARVHIETVPPPGMPPGGSYVISYDVRIPPAARADISSTNGLVKGSGLDGKVKITAISGKVELEDMGGGIDGVVANGSMTVRMNRVTAAVRLEVTNGSLVLDLPAATKANLSARVINGALGVSGLIVPQPTGRRIKELETLLNGGGPEVSTRVTNGRLSIEGK